MVIDMKKFAVIENGVVSNVIVAEDDFAQSIGAILISGDVVIGDLWNGTSFTKPAPTPFDRGAAVKSIDKAVMAVYEKPIVLGDEYKLREAGADAYKAANYTGTVPLIVQGFATPAGLTARAATDLILSQSAQLRGALSQLGNLRMQKYAVSTASTDDQAKAIFDSTMASIAAIAAAIA
jgi:hypothetical protein